MSIPQQLEAVDFYRQQLLHSLNMNNISDGNIESVFFYGFDDSHIKEFCSLIPKALNQLGRPFAKVACGGRTSRQLYRDLARAFGGDVSDSDNIQTCWRSLRECMLVNSMTVVVEMLSTSKITRKFGIARELIKMLDDAHLRGPKPRSNIVFIDRASFLESSWAEIGICLRLVAPYDPLLAWTDDITLANGPILRPV